MDIESKLEEAERKAIDSLSRYKFWMFGYWAAIWVEVNSLDNIQRPNPFKSLVHLAREMKETGK